MFRFLIHPTPRCPPINRTPPDVSQCGTVELGTANAICWRYWPIVPQAPTPQTPRLNLDQLGSWDGTEAVWDYWTPWKYLQWGFDRQLRLSPDPEPYRYGRYRPCPLRKRNKETFSRMYLGTDSMYSMYGVFAVWSETKTTNQIPGRTGNAG